MTNETIFISGANGFIAAHIVKQLIQDDYRVIGTVRSREKGERLKKLLKSNKFDYEIVADIKKEGAFDEALKKHPEATVFLHTASPFHFNTQKPEEDLLITAVNGTKNALMAIDKYGTQIKRVVVTSSIAAMTNLNKDQDPSYVVNENSWNPISWELGIKGPVLGYLASKTFAEKAAWEYVELNKPHFTMTVVNPSYVFGPQAFQEEVKETLNTSAEIINTLLKLDPDDGVPLMKGPFIDVRDVARAHIVAFQKEEAKNQRLLLSECWFTSQMLLDFLHEQFPQFAQKLPVGEPGTTRDVEKKAYKVENSRTRKILGFPFISLKKSTIDSIQQILDAR